MSSGTVAGYGLTFITFTVRCANRSAADMYALDLDVGMKQISLYGRTIGDGPRLKFQSWREGKKPHAVWRGVSRQSLLRRRGWNKRLLLSLDGNRDERWSVGRQRLLESFLNLLLR